MSQPFPFVPFLLNYCLVVARTANLERANPRIMFVFQTRTRPNSSLLANNLVTTDNVITKVSSNGNLQIKMHGFTSQDLTQR